MAGNIREAFEAVGVEAPPDVLHAIPAGGDPPASLPAGGGLHADEIQPGCVVLRLDPILLQRDNRVRYTWDTPVTQIGPFVCVEVSSGSEETTWTALTRKERPGRLVIEEAWRQGGNYKWRRGQLFLLDGARLWRGPREAFVSASWREALNNPVQRARLTPEGLVALRQRIEAQEPR